MCPVLFKQTNTLDSSAIAAYYRSLTFLVVMACKLYIYRPYRLYPKLAKTMVTVELTCVNYHDFEIVRIEYWTKYLFFIWRYLQNNFKFVYYILQRDSSNFFNFHQANCYNIYVCCRSQSPISNGPNFCHRTENLFVIYIWHC